MKHISVVGGGERLEKGLGGAVGNEKEVFAGELDDKRKAFVKLVVTKNIQTRVVEGVLSAIRMDVNSVGSWGMT